MDIELGDEYRSKCIPRMLAPGIFILNSSPITTCYASDFMRHTYALCLVADYFQPQACQLLGLLLRHHMIAIDLAVTPAGVGPGAVRERPKSCPEPGRRA